MEMEKQVSRHISKFAKKLNGGEIRTYEEYCNDKLHNIVAEYIDLCEAGINEYSNLEEFVIESYSYHYQDGGIEMWDEVCDEYLALWTIEHGFQLIQTVLSEYSEHQQLIGNKHWLLTKLVEDGVMRVLHGGCIDWEIFPTDEVEALIQKAIRLTDK